MFTSVGSADFKQHINLSTYAYEIIWNDIRSFMEKPSMSGFLNKLIEEYQDYADASIFSALVRKRESLNLLLTEIPDSEEKEMIVNKLVRQYKRELQEQIDSYPKGIYIKFRLNKKNFSALYEETCPEGQYFDSQGKYIKAIVEEYAWKTPLEREGIFFGNRLSDIQGYINSGLLVRVKTRKGWTYEVKPYDIRVDTSGLYHYLAGIATSPADPDSKPRISSFRISLLTSVSSRPKSYRTGKVTQTEAEQIEKQIQKKGIQFLLGDAEEITVRLDDLGRKMFSSQLHLRPAPDSIDENGIYHFSCTQSQIIYYFFKFGAHAEIIGPEDLRGKFVQQYIDAIKIYRDYTKAAQETQEIPFASLS